MKFSTFVGTAIGLVMAGSAVAVPTAMSTIPSTISDTVRRELAGMDPSEYQLHDLISGASNATGLTKRGAPINGYITRCTSTKCLSMTFDDGPYIYHNIIVDTLQAAGEKGTFFVNGNNYACIYDEDNVQRLRYGYERGHQVCSHTWSHPDISKLSNAQLDQQVQLVEDALWRILGVVPACFRAPYGSIRDDQVKYLNNRWGYVVIGWNYDTNDANGAGTAAGLKVYKDLKAPTHAIILNHETVPGTSKTVIPQAVNIVRQNGYTGSQTVSATLGFNPYKVTGKYGTRDGSWTCSGKPNPGPN